MKHRLSVLGLLSILGVLMLVGCGETAPQAPEGWLTYVNETHGYSFYYPPDCHFGPMPSYCKQSPPQERPPECLCFLDTQDPNQVTLQKLTVEGDNITAGMFEISCHDTPAYNPPSGTDVTEWVKRHWLEMHADIPDEPNMELGGVPAVKVDDAGGAMAPAAETIYLIRNDKLLRIHMLEAENENNRELYDQLISGFAFK